MNSSIRHHFVPQGFLRGFGTSEETSFVWVYDKTPGYAPKKKSVRSVAWAPAYYATERDDGTQDTDSLEFALAKTIDNDVPRIIRAINARPGVSVDLPEADRALLAFFIGLSITRVPSFRDGMNDFYSQVAQTSLGYMLDKEPELAEIDEKFGGIKAVAKPWVSLAPMLTMAADIAKSVLKKEWQFYTAPENVALVTTDNPVLISGGAAGLDMLGPAHPAAELVINLRKDLSLVCTPKRGFPWGAVFKMTPDVARKFNRGLVKAARQRVFCDHHSVTFDQFVKKYHGMEQRLIGQ